MIQKKSFSELGLSKEVLKAIEDMGFEEATPIQSETIPVMLQGIDVIGQARTGTGKTAAFAIPAIERVDCHLKQPQVIVLCPTRELAIQVAVEIDKLASHKRGIYIVPIYGGQAIERQIHALRRGAHIVIGTPGRILDHLKRKTLALHHVKLVILDEADEMLDMGFRDDIEAIIRQCPKNRQTVLFSATMASAIRKLAQAFQTNPRIISIAQGQITAPDVEQSYYEADPRMKLDVLTRLIDVYNPRSTIIFCNTKRKADEVAHSLVTYGYLAQAIHGDMNQDRRNRIMKKFREGQIDFLVATDVAARGIDVPHVEIIINFDIPQDEESYVHRIGRTGRAGRSGKAFNLVSGKEVYALKNIQRFTKSPIQQRPIPPVSQVAEIKAGKLLEKIRSVIAADNLAHYREVISKLLKDDITTLDIAAALLKMLSSQKDTRR